MEIKSSQSFDESKGASNTVVIPLLGWMKLKAGVPSGGSRQGKTVAAVGAPLRRRAVGESSAPGAAGRDR